MHPGCVATIPEVLATKPLHALTLCAAPTQRLFAENPSALELLEKRMRHRGLSWPHMFPNQVTPQGNLRHAAARMR